MHRAFFKRIKYVLVFAVFLLLILFLIDNAAKAMFPLKYKEAIVKYSSENSIDPYLVFAIVKAESNFNPAATSPRDARGLMQIAEVTGSWAAESLDIKGYTFERLYEPDLNIKIGCWYIKRLMKEFSNNVDLVIAAYNGGSGNVSQWLKDRNYSSSGNSLDKIPFKETERFLKRVKNYYAIYMRLYEKGI